MAQLMTQGQALSTWSFSGSLLDSATALFQDTTDASALRPIRVQGFYWSGRATITVADSEGVVLFNSIIPTSPSIWPPSASGSFGIITTAPLYMTVTSGSGPSTTYGIGGTLRVYGEVL